MMYFENESFQKFNFKKEQIKKYFGSARRDILIAQKSTIPEVIFKFSYDALIKIGITLIAKKGFKIRSRAGHHIKILEKLSKLLNDEDIEILGNKMREERNLDLYGGGRLISKKESQEYLTFIKKVFKKAKKKF